MRPTSLRTSPSGATSSRTPSSRLTSFSAVHAWQSTRPNYVENTMMSPNSRFDDPDKLVDTDKGFISREIFVDPDLYKEELEKVFTRAWLFIGHESLIPKPGDFYTTRMGEESVILCRDKQGIVHAFLNSCRHRGMKVCRYEQGNTSIFTCPYHSWTYTTDGKLQGVPQYRSLYDANLDRDANSLVSVAKLAIFK